MPWNLLGHLGLLSLWAACGLLPWCLALFVARGRGTLTALPAAAVAGMAGGLLVPALGADGGTGFAASLAAAMASGALAVVLTVRRSLLARRTLS